MTALENLYTRRSIRRYKPEQITDEALEQVLKAGTLAPTGMMIGVSVTFFACYFFIPTFFTLTPLDASGFLILVVLGLLAWPVLKLFNTLNDKLKSNFDDLRYNRGRHAAAGGKHSKRGE